MALATKEETIELAKESHKTKRAREKLKKKFRELDQAITEHALEQKTIEIHRWISRHAPHRVVLKSKSISLFDENQNTAKLSRRIQGIVQKLHNTEAVTSKSLKDRVIKT